MPASTLDPVNAAIRSSLSKTASETNLDIQLAGATKKALLADIEFEPAGSYQSTVLDKLKNKYIVLKSTDNSQQTSSNTENMGADEILTLAKHELYPLEAVQLGWSNSDWIVGAGMVNMGNTCYLNSTLQALFHVPALVNWLVSDKHHMSQCEDSGGLCIICAMRKTLHDSQQRNTNSIRPFLIYNKLRVVCRNLIPGRQEDAHEFLRYLVEAMEKAYLSRFKNHSEFDSRTKETTPLNQILGGYLRSAVRCLECGHVSTTFQHFQDLLLDIRKAQTLEEALDGYFSREKLDDESYHCESCQKKVPATKQFTLERAPMVLCIQLKRFSVSNNKITKHVQFRQRLELTKYTRHRPPVPLVYRFVALVTHMGPTVGCGHYTAVAQAPCGNYYQFDDSMVRPISHQAVFNTNAYIMLYELECPPFSALKSQNNGTSTVSAKIKSATTVNTSNSCISSSAGGSGACNSSNGSNSQLENNRENKSSLGSSKLQFNGSRVLYGPELPPKLEMLMLTTTTRTTATKSQVASTIKSTMFERNNVISSSGVGGGSGVTNSNNNNNIDYKSAKMNGNSLDREASSPSTPTSSSSGESDSEQNTKKQITSSSIKENGGRTTDITALTVSTTSSNMQTCRTIQKLTKNNSPSSVSYKATSKLVNNSSNEIAPLSSSKFAASNVSCVSASKAVGGGGDDLILKATESLSTAIKRESDSTSPKGAMPTTASLSASTQTITKLVPYDVDDDDDDGDEEEEEDDADEEEDNEDDEGNSSSSSSGGGGGGTVCSFVESEVTTNSNPSRNGDAIRTTALSAAPTTGATRKASGIATSTALSLSDSSRVQTKATIGDWKVTSSLDRNVHGPSNEGRSWDKKNKLSSYQKEEKCATGITTNNTIGELLKMSHGGYSAPVNSWNGLRAGLDMEFAEERREDRKRSICDNFDRGRMKHMKTNNSSYKSNPGYNRIQEFHNVKNNWNQNNNGGSSYGGGSGNNNSSRQFYNTSGKHRNRRNNFHHKNSYHKNNYTFRQ